MSLADACSTFTIVMCPPWSGTAAGLLVVGVFVSLRAREDPPTPWSRLTTSDVHSLQFTDDDGGLLFGHHGGLLGSTDGGVTWARSAFSQDVMMLAATADGSIVVAGHEVLQLSQDGGGTWDRMATDLPSLDIHAFARSPSDPSRMWAYVAGGGVFTTADSGRGWLKVFDGDLLALVAVGSAAGDLLLGVSPFQGLVRSDDRGARWQPLGTNPTAPVTSLTATTGAGAILVGGPDGLFRSDDVGVTFRRVLTSDAVLAVASANAGETVVAVTDTGFVYRSDDGGATWPGPPATQ